MRGTWMQELKQRPWRDVAYWLLLHGLLGLLSYTTEDHLPVEWLCSWKVGPVHINHYSSNYPIDLCTGQPDGDIFSTEFPLQLAFLYYLEPPALGWHHSQ